MANAKKWIYGIVAEASFFLFLYYVQTLMEIEGNLWISSFVLWALLNLSIVFCPVVRRCYK
jgi:hypothetical protein